MKDLPVVGLIEQFLADSANNMAPETGARYRRFLEDFSGLHPKRMLHWAVANRLKATDECRPT